MIFEKNLNSRPSLPGNYYWFFVIAWTIIIGAFLFLGIFQIQRIQQEMVKNEARANFNKDQALRLWATTHGGVYVPITEGTPQNPYLSHVKDRDIKTPDGKALTLMNPAYMLRQTMKEYENLYGVRGHITSLQYFRPETAPDEWEKSGLQQFESGVKEISEFTERDGKPYFRYMSPMIVKEGCLKCHGHQGYKVGDVRGGVSVSVPMAPYLANEHRQIISYSFPLGFLWLLGLIGFNWANRGLRNRARERDMAEAELKKAHGELDQRVRERTAELAIITEELRAEITERKQAEERIKASLKEKEVLLGEIYHRTKNNMQVICSLLSIQSMHITDKRVLTIFEETENRIRAMSLVHQKLYQARDLSRIDLKDYIKDLGDHLLTSYQAKPGRILFHVEGDSIPILIDYAVPCGLIVNELISNSLKHAFPNDRDGEILISLHVSDDEIEMDFRDNGIGLPKGFDLENCESLGLGLVRDLTKGQLRGETELKEAQGMEFQIRFKQSSYKARV